MCHVYFSPLSVWLEDERQFRQQQTREKVLLAEGHRQLEHADHSLILNVTRESRTLQKTESPLQKMLSSKSSTEVCLQTAHKTHLS